VYFLQKPVTGQAGDTCVSMIDQNQMMKVNLGPVLMMINKNRKE
jgi:hypothetical protein